MVKTLFQKLSLETLTSVNITQSKVNLEILLKKIEQNIFENANIECFKLCSLENLHRRLEETFHEARSF